MGCLVDFGTIERIGGRVNPQWTPSQLSHAVHHVVDRLLILLPGSEAILQVGRHLTGGRGHALADLPLSVTLLLQVGDVGVVAHCFVCLFDGILQGLGRDRGHRWTPPQLSLLGTEGTFQTERLQSGIILPEVVEDLALAILDLIPEAGVEVHQVRFVLTPSV